MNTAKVKKALKKLSKQKGISERAARQEIEIAIQEAMKSPDPQVQVFWKSIPHKGEQPTSEEIIAYIAGYGKGIE